MVKIGAFEKKIRIIKIIFLILFFIALFWSASQNYSKKDLTINNQNQQEQQEEQGVSTTTEKTTEKEKFLSEIIPFKFVEVVDSCGPIFDTDCLNVRSGPGTEYPIITRLRKGAVLNIPEQINIGDKTWYKINFDEWLRYPERVKEDWYIDSDFVKILPIWYENETERATPETIKSRAKKIIVSISEQKLSAYGVNGLFMESLVSTGIEVSPTPKGVFRIFKKMPSRYMQGPIQYYTSKYYDLPGVPWNMYFTAEGAVIHGTYWHNDFGNKHSSGCVNLNITDAKKLYDWAEIGTTVVIVE
jgi:hypothetical protein